MGSKKDSIVLDMTAGSGTTAHAVMSLNHDDGGTRRFILIEQESYAHTITAERVRRAIMPMRGAKSEKYASMCGLGGSFAYYTLGKPMDIEQMLTGESLPEYADLAMFLLHLTGVSGAAPKQITDRKSGHFYSTDSVDYYMFYKPDLSYLRSRDSTLSEDRINAIFEKGRNAVVFAADKSASVGALAEKNISYVKIPDVLYRGA